MTKILRNFRAKCTNGGGFTLAELLIVVAVIAVLVAVAIPTFGSQLEKSRQAADVANLRDVYSVAKLAVLNQDDPDPDASDNDGAKYLNDKKGTATDATILTVYVDPDSGKFYEKPDDVKDGVNLSVGKSTGSRIIENTDPSAVIYNGNVEGKPIIVEFTYSTKTRAFSVSTVKFSNETSSNTVPEVALKQGASAEAPSKPTNEVAVSLAVGTAKVFNVQDYFTFTANYELADNLKIEASPTIEKDGSSYTDSALTVNTSTFKVSTTDAIEEGEYTVVMTVTAKAKTAPKDGDNAYVGKVQMTFNVSRIEVTPNAGATGTAAVAWDVGTVVTESVGSAYELKTGTPDTTKDFAARYKFVNSKGMELAVDSWTIEAGSIKKGGTDFTAGEGETAFDIDENGILTGKIKAGVYTFNVIATTGETKAKVSFKLTVTDPA